MRPLAHVAQLQSRVAKPAGSPASSRAMNWTPSRAGSAMRPVRPGGARHRWIDAVEFTVRANEREDLPEVALGDALNGMSSARPILDLGTGDGSLLALLRINRPENGVGLDFSELGFDDVELLTEVAQESAPHRHQADRGRLAAVIAGDPRSNTSANRLRALEGANRSSRPRRGHPGS
jgi:hypothetical protein